MTLQFKRLSDKVDVNVKEYVDTILSTRNDVRIYVGTDSQNHKGSTIFATVIVFHYGNHGGHVLFAKQKVDRFRNNNQRLWQEVMYSVEVAEHILENCKVKVDYIDLDLNPDPKYNSNQILRAAIGWVESLGFEPRVKSLGPYASIMADVICR